MGSGVSHGPPEQMVAGSTQVTVCLLLTYLLGLNTKNSGGNLVLSRLEMSKHKKQHYIPSSYLKAWSDNNCPAGQTPYIWIFDADGSNPRKKAPENVLHETDLYTISQDDGSRNLVLEHGLRELEDKFCRIRKRILRLKRTLETKDRVFLCAFVAAMHCRTLAKREHWREQWGNVLSRAEEMQDWLDKATPEQLSRARTTPTISSYSEDSERGLSVDDVRDLRDKPLQRMLPSMLSKITPVLEKMDLAVLNAPKGHYFLTTDDPCVWFDPDAYKRHPFYRSPGLAYPKIEITLPISPDQTVLFNRQGTGGYRNVPAAVVDELNRRTRAHAHKYFVFNQNETNPFWFYPGAEPEDSWEKTHPPAKSGNGLST